MPRCFQRISIMSTKTLVDFAGSEVQVCFDLAVMIKRDHSVRKCGPSCRGSLKLQESQA